VAAAHAARSGVLIAGIAVWSQGDVHGCSEYVSVSSQADTERADLVREGKELAVDDVNEHKDCVNIRGSGLDAPLAKQVASN